MPEAVRGRELIFLSTSFVERFTSVLYPIEMAWLLRVLPEAKWVVDDRIFQEGLPSGRAAASKGDSRLIVNQDNKTLGVGGLDPAITLKDFKEFREFWTQRSRLDPLPQTHFAEFNVTARVFSNKNPLATFQALSARSPFPGLASGVGTLPPGLVHYGIRLVKPGTVPTETSWFDMRVEPAVVATRTQYHIQIVWREPSLETIVNGAEDIRTTLGRVIDGIEGAAA